MLSLALSIALVVPFSAPPSATRADPNPNLARAADAYAAMQRTFAHPRRGVYAETSLRVGWRPARAWPYSQALAATLALARVSDVYRADALAALRGLGAYWNPSVEPGGYDSGVRAPLGTGGPEFYDDNEWIGLDLVTAYDALGRRSALRRAAQLFKLVRSGWDVDASHPCPGGVFWARDGTPDHRNTVSTANGSLLALALARDTRDRQYLPWAERMWSWVHACLRAPNGLFWDHIDGRGTAEPTQWSYNQGAMIAAGALLYEATGDRAYLDDAEQIADTAVAAFGPRLDAEPPEFVAIFLRDLMLLHDVDPTRSYASLLADYGERAWTTWRDPHTGLFRFRRGRPVQLLQQAAMVQIYAELARAGG